MKLFDSLENSVYPVRSQKGIRFEWSITGVGFGLLSLSVTRSKAEIDTECMATDTCVSIMMKAIGEGTVSHVWPQHSPVTSRDRCVVPFRTRNGISLHWSIPEHRSMGIMTMEVKRKKLFTNVISTSAVGYHDTVAYVLKTFLEENE